MAKHKGNGGRKRGSSNQGFWFRKGRGWYVSEGRSAVPLCSDNKKHIKDEGATEEARQAFERYQKAREASAKRQATGDDRPIIEVCRAYLDHLAKHGAKATYTLRSRLLFDCCTGLPPKFQGGKHKPTSKDRIHPGLGEKAVGELRGIDVDRWLDAHPDWNGTRRAAVQALRRAIRFAVEKGLITQNPIQGYKVAQSGKRVVYFSDETEQLLYANACEAVALALKVCIRTGARPVSEFAALEARHVEETERGQLWRFPETEHKTGHLTHSDRIIYVPQEVAETVRKLVKQYPSGKLFRNSTRKPWTAVALKSAFRRLRKKLKSQGVELDEDCSFYACRHTYAKRMLGGFWGPAVTLEVLAGLMGNSPKIAWGHYAKWIPAYSDPFWRAVGNGDSKPQSRP